MEGHPFVIILDLVLPHDNRNGSQFSTLLLGILQRVEPYYSVELGRHYYPVLIAQSKQLHQLLVDLWRLQKYIAVRCLKIVGLFQPLARQSASFGRCLAISYLFRLLKLLFYVSNSRLSFSHYAIEAGLGVWRLLLTMFIIEIHDSQLVETLKRIGLLDSDWFDVLYVWVVGEEVVPPKSIWVGTISWGRWSWGLPVCRCYLWLDSRLISCLGVNFEIYYKGMRGRVRENELIIRPKI